MSDAMRAAGSGTLPGGASLTSAQQEAIHARGNILVVAGAGTGKTRTLIERVLNLVREGVPLHRFLLVTFTEAAAAEMRGRLRASLERLALEHPNHHHFREQLVLLDVSRISTLHSFCYELVRHHFHVLSMDPQLIVLDESQSLPLVEKALDTVFTPLLEGGDGVAQQTQAWLKRTRAHGPEALRALVWRVHRYTRSLADPEAWMERQTAEHSLDGPEAWLRWIPGALADWLEEWADRLSVNGAREMSEYACKAIEAWNRNPDLEAVRKLLFEFRHADELWPKGRKTVLRKPLTKFFEGAEQWLEFLVPVSDTESGTTCLEADWSVVRQPMRLLIQLVERFDAEYSRLKRELGGIDFADLEQFALRLLWKGKEDRTEIALQLQSELDHVFVDEVQDINAAQDAILRAVSRDGSAANRFLVGDVKQSIYRFRLADPRIFSGYERVWRGNHAQGRVIDLLDNFRSSEAVLNWVNDLFGELMQPSTGGVDYARTARLQFGSPERRQALKANSEDPAVEMHILTGEGRGSDPSDEGDGESGAGEVFDLSRAEREAAVVASRLLELKVQGFQIWDETLQSRRPVIWSDMVVLMRSPAGSAEVYAKVFHEHGIPLLADRGGFFEAQEVLDLLSLLRVLDNPLNDIPLLALLRSPLFGFTPTDLVEIRLAGRRVDFWTALQKFASGTQQTEWTWDEGAENQGIVLLRQQVGSFLHQVQRWRELLRLSSLTHCLESILALTGYEAILLAMPRGGERVANVRRLLDLARQFDPYQRQGLHRFLMFVESQEASDIAHEAAPPVGEEMVKLMSIHRSKGLEFPVVVLAELGRMFNFREQADEVLLDEEYGLCPQVTLEESGWRFPTIAHWAARHRARRQLLGEEMRLLYVGTTRARDRLILTGVHRGVWRGLESAEDVDGDGSGDVQLASRHSLLQARCFLDWLELWLRRHAALSGAKLEDDSEGQTSLLRWRIGAQPTVAQRGDEGGDVGPSQTVAAVMDVQGVLSRVRWRYPNESATREPVKTTVTVLRKRVMEGEDRAVVWFDPEREQTKVKEMLRPRHPTLDPALARERGVVTHRFIQFLDLSRSATQLDLRNESLRMEREGLFSGEETALIDFDALTAFWQSTVGTAIRAAAPYVQRELPFTARLDVGELQNLGVISASQNWAPGEFVVVQGQMDLVVLKPNEIWIVDFKTDEQRRDGFESRLRAYRPQIILYGLALERIYGKPVSRRWIHFLQGPHTALVEPAGTRSGPPR